MDGENYYFFVHGKKPRGYGSWAFKTANGEIMFINDSYANAKKQALKTLKSPVLQP